MIVLASSVVPYRGSDVIRNFVKIQQQLLQGHFLNGFGCLSDCLVQVIDISAIVFVVMNLHRQRVDVGFESIVWVPKRSQFERVC